MALLGRRESLRATLWTCIWFLAMRVLQNPPPLSKKKVTYSDTETFWLQLPHILYRAFDQLFGTVTHSAGNVSFYFIGSDVSRQGRSKTREKSASAEHKYSASAYMYDPAHKWMHLCAFSHMHTQIQYPCWAGGCGGEPRVADRSWHGVNSFNDGRHDSSSCVPARLRARVHASPQLYWSCARGVG